LPQTVDEEVDHENLKYFHIFISVFYQKVYNIKKANKRICIKI